MQYDNLHDLIHNSNSSWKYFVSLPVAVQAELHKHNDYIHSAEQFHIHADLIQKNIHYIKNGGWLS